jgi:hypothetical protein
VCRRYQLSTMQSRLSARCRIEGKPLEVGRCGLTIKPSVTTSYHVANTAKLPGLCAFFVYDLTVPVASGDCRLGGTSDLCPLQTHS